MRKFSVLILVLALAVSLAGCAVTTNAGGRPGTVAKGQDSRSGGHTGTGEQITEDQAARIALEHANVTADQVSGLRVSDDVDDGVPEYEVEFHHDHWEYEYEIHAETGDIRSYDRDD